VCASDRVQRDSPSPESANGTPHWCYERRLCPANGTGCEAARAGAESRYAAEDGGSHGENVFMGGSMACVFDIGGILRAVVVFSTGCCLTVSCGVTSRARVELGGA
jgi:hypothetical protein